MEQLRVRTLASHPSFSSLGSGSSGYFTPVCGLIDHEFTPEIDRHSLTSRVSHQDMEVFCKNSKPGFVKRLGLAGKRICSGGKHALANKSKKKQGHPVKQTVHRSASSFTVVATAVSAVQRELVCDEHACNRVHSRVEEYKPEESRSSCRVYGLGASSHEEEPTAANVIKDESKEVSSQAPVSVEKLKSMSGTWQLVKSMSGGIQQLCDLLELGWVLRKALDNSDIIEVSSPSKKSLFREAVTGVWFGTVERKAQTIEWKSAEFEMILGFFWRLFCGARNGFLQRV